VVADAEELAAGALEVAAGALDPEAVEFKQVVLPKLSEYTESEIIK